MAKENETQEILANEFVEVLKKQKEMMAGKYEKIEVPPMTKKELWKYVTSQYGELFLEILFSPLIFFASFLVAAGSYGGTVWFGIRFGFETIFSSFWETGVQKPLFEFKRTYGIDKEPVYKMVSTSDKGVIQATDEMVQKIGKLIK